MSRKSIFLLSIVLVFTFMTPVFSETTEEPIATYKFNKYFCEVYNPLNVIAKKPATTIPDMIYPDTTFLLQMTITGSDEKLTPKEKRLISNYDWQDSTEKIKEKYFAKAFAPLNSAIKKAEAVFKKTQKLAPKDQNKKRDAALKKLNITFHKFVDGLENNKSILTFISVIKKNILKLMPNAKFHHTILVENQPLPSKKKGLLSGWTAKSASRKKFIDGLDRFGKINYSQKENEPMFPIVAYVDFPCEYIVSPMGPEINGLIKIPNRLSKDNFFHIHHTFNERDWPRIRKADTLKSEHFPGKLYKLSDEFAEKLFKNKMAPTEFANLNQKLIKTAKAEQKKLATDIENTLYNQVFKGNKLTNEAKQKYRFIENWEFELPGDETELSFCIPTSINTNLKFTQKDLEQELEEYLTRFAPLSKNLKTFNEKIQKAAIDLDKAIIKQKKTSNKDLKSIFTDKKVSEPLAILTMRNKKHANSFINNWENLKKFVKLSKSLWTKADILKYKNNKPKVAAELKSLLLKGHQLFNCWQDARVNSFDRHEYLKRTAAQLAKTNSPKSTEAYEFLKMYASTFVSEIKWAIKTANADTKSEDIKKAIKSLFSKK